MSSTQTPPRHTQESPIIYPQRVRWTHIQASMMIEASVFAPHKIELLHGTIYQKMAPLQPHAAANDNGYDALTDVFGKGYVQHSSPIVIDEESSPEPDIAVLKEHRRIYTDNPKASDCLLVVEVSDSTLAMDKTTKASLYAKAGILEYWIININAQTVIVHREPSFGSDVGEAGYGNIQTYDRTKSIATLAKPEVLIAVADLLP
jgi:Uma2 family endonuclease